MYNISKNNVCVPLLDVMPRKLKVIMMHCDTVIENYFSRIMCKYEHLLCHGMTSRQGENREQLKS